MKRIITVLVIALSVLGPWAGSHAQAAPAAKKNPPKKTRQGKAADTEQNKFRLKPGAEQKICLTCHPAFEDLLKKRSVHTPVKTPGCKACHNPHTSHFPKQLPAEVNKVCYTCHAGIIEKNAKSTHRPVLEGKCVNCHDPHSSDNKANLLKAGNELCYGCHKEKIDAIKAVKSKHPPVEEDCLNCHNPHSSPESASLLKHQAPALCKECHDTNSAVFLKRHANYPVGNATCTKCHNAHGSNMPGLIYDTAHKPFASRMCNQCHEGPNTSNPLALRKKGYELCRGCHNNTVNDMFGKNRLHWPVLGKQGCLNCHNPHASTEQSLLTAKMPVLCGRCHADVMERLEKSPTKHEPIKDGLCTACHMPHASDNVFLTNQASIVEFCGTCHDYMKHSTHPVGEKVIDKRNKNLNVDCLSCHRSHGTEYKKMIPFGVVSELCTQCHMEFQR